MKSPAALVVTTALLAFLFGPSQVVSSSTEAIKEAYVAPPTTRAFYAETFENQTTTSLFNASSPNHWVKSSVPKYHHQKISIQRSSKLLKKFARDKGLVMDAKAQHYAFGKMLPEPFVLDGTKKSLVVQYQVKYPRLVECAGTYMKLLRATPGLNLSQLNDSTPFSIMFGPDKCDKTNKVHFIFNHENPKTHVIEQKELEVSPEMKNDRSSHVYTLAIHDADNTFEMYADLKLIKNGSLYTLFKPPVLLPREIDDPTDEKPQTWEETEFIPDPNAKKPDDWDESAPKTIPNPEFKKPEDWDDATQGPWRQPRMTNPAYRGKWTPPMIENPDFVGEWEPRKIPNPDFFEDDHAARMAPIGAIAFEVWTMTENIQIDNIWLGYDLEAAKNFARKTCIAKREEEAVAQEMEEDPAKKPPNPHHGGPKTKELNIFDHIDQAIEWVIKYPLVAFLGAVFIGLVLLGIFNPTNMPPSHPISPIIQEVLNADKKTDVPTPRVPVVDETQGLRQRPSVSAATQEA
ncbi:hypothetical protein LEN26_005448 [Aphanomyces euteiches]|nr:hypothetical protein AeMF1_000385 [Aphanomyces euteiches]KAH9138050.1 hypothetical protein LEN26_005448 [Aphanomyces euteiches]KAH9193527.1 hypothetical protein AeNC1_004500 [Aphanomyces euteiches]